MTGLGGIWFRGAYDLVHQSRFSTSDTVSLVLDMDHSHIYVFKNFEFLYDLHIEGKYIVFPSNIY